MRIFALAAVIAIPTSACVPITPIDGSGIPDTFEATGADQDTAASPEDWLGALEDPFLESLVDRALSDNLELAEAIARTERARATARLRRTDLLPEASVSAAAQTDRTSEATALLGALSGESGPDISIENPADLFDIGVDVSWELDLFGANRAALRAAHADYVAAQADKDAASLRITAELVRSYARARLSERILSINAEFIEAQEKTVGVVEAKVEFGATTEDDLVLAQGRLASLRADRPVLLADLAASQYAIAVLIGETPKTLLDIWQDGELSVPGAISLPHPIEILPRRPDVVAAEYRLRASSLRIGAEVAEYYPKLQLGASIGSQATDSDTLFSAAARTYSYGPILNWRILDFAAINAAVDSARGRERELLAQHRLTLLRAVEEIEREALRFKMYKTALASRKIAVARQTRALGLISDRYSEGDIELLDVLDAERSLLDEQVQEAHLLSDILIAYSVLAKALGGYDSTRIPR